MQVTFNKTCHVYLVGIVLFRFIKLQLEIKRNAKLMGKQPLFNEVKIKSKLSWLLTAMLFCKVPREFLYDQTLNGLFTK